MKKNMEQKDFWIVGKHAVCEAIKNKKRTTTDIAILEQNSDSIKAITSSKFKIVNKRFFNKICENQHYHIKAMQLKLSLLKN